jgi:RNA polymerase sigma factor (sigma-70 family)
MVTGLEHYEGLVGAIAYEFSRKFHMVEVADLRQELWLWFLTHPKKVHAWESLDDKQAVKLISRSLRNAAKDFCQKEKARIVGYHVDDNYYYDRQVLEILLPAVFRGDNVAPSMIDLGFTSTRKVASEGGNWFAMMSDIDKALKKLPDEQYNILYLRFVDSLDNAHMASELQISDDAARMRVNRAVNSLLNLLGGSRPRKERDYTDAEATNNIGDGAESVGESEDEVTIQELD